MTCYVLPFAEKHINSKFVLSDRYVTLWSHVSTSPPVFIKLESPECKVCPDWSNSNTHLFLFDSSWKPHVLELGVNKQGHNVSHTDARSPDSAAACVVMFHFQVKPSLC